MKEFAGTMRHRESPGETVSLAQLGRTRAPLYSASLPLRGPTKAFLVFDTSTTLVAHSVSHSFFFFQSLSLSFFFLSIPSRETSREKLSLREEEGKTEGYERNLCTLVATFAGSMTPTCEAHATLSKEESLEARIIAVFSLAAKVKEKDSD